MTIEERIGKAAEKIANSIDITDPDPALIADILTKELRDLYSETSLLTARARMATEILNGFLSGMPTSDRTNDGIRQKYCKLSVAWADELLAVIVET